MNFGVAAFRSCSRTNTLVHSKEHFMQPASQTIPKCRLWTGRVLSTILVLFLLFDAIAKSNCPPPTLGQAEGGRYKQNAGGNDSCI
jgi:hypothetical protein